MRSLLQLCKTNKSALPALFVLAGFLSINNTHAQLLYADDFNSGYLPYINVAGQNSWTKAGSGPDISVQNASPITYAGYEGSTGDAYIQMPTASGTASRVYRSFTSTTAGTNTFFYSFILNLSSATATGDYFISLGDPGAGSAYFARLFARSSGGGFNIGIAKSSATGTYGSTVYNFNTNYLVVVRFSFITGATNDAAYVWVNPSLAAEPLTGSAEASISTGAEPGLSGGNVGNFHWHNRSGNNPVGKFDGVRVSVGATSAAAWTNLAAAKVTNTVNGTIAAGEYGAHFNSQNQVSSATGTWYMNYDATNLYIGIAGTNTAEGAVFYLDKDPVLPVNGGSNSNGNLVGNNYDGSNFANLQFRADLVIYFKDGYREYRTADGSGGWSGATTSFGSYSSASGTRELSIPWSAIGGIPANFNWFGYVAYSGGGAYASVPVENPGSGAGLVIGGSARWERYFTVNTGASTRPFARNCYVFNQTADQSGFGAINVHDFTMNASGRTLTRGTGSWVITGGLRIDAGTISFGTVADACTVGGSLFNTGTLTLSTAIGGDINMQGDITDNGTFNANNRAVFFTGNNVQTIQGSGTFDISYVRVNKTGGRVVLGSNLVCAGPNGGNAMEISGTTSILDLNGFSLTLGQGGVGSTYNSTISPAGFIRGNPASSISILGTGALGTISFETGNRSLASLTINRTSTGSVTLGTDLTVGTGLTLTDGALNIGTNILTLNGTVARTTGSIGASTGTVTFSGGSAQSVPASVFTSDAVSNLNIPNTNGVTFNGNAAVSGTMTVNGLFTPASTSVISGAGTVTGTGTIQVTGATGTNDLSVQYTLNRTLTNLTVEYAGAAAQGLNSITYGGLKISNGSGVNMGGAVTVNGTLNLNTGNLSLAGNGLTLNGAVTRTSGNLAGSNTSSLTCNGTTGSLFFASGGTNNFLKALTIGASGSATLGNALNITAWDGSAEGVLTVTSGGSLASAGFLTLKSSSSGTARVEQGNSSGGYITGDVTVERFIPQNSRKGWRLLASNTSGQTINAAWQEGAVGDGVNPNPGFGTILTGRTSTFGTLGAAQAAGYDALTSGHGLLKYDAATDNLLGVPNTNSTNIESEQGYFVFIRGDRQSGSIDVGTPTAPTTSTVLRSRGTLFTGDQSPVATGAQGWALVRNPYASRIDMRNISRSASLVDAFQVWDPKVNTVGVYQTFTKNLVSGNYEVTPGGGSYGTSGSVQNFIESGLAFFIQGATGETATVTESCKTSGSSVAFRPATPQNAGQRVYFSLYAVNAATTDLADGGYADFDNLYVNTVDGYDVHKSPNFSENFGLIRDGVSLVVERRSAINRNDTLFFNMNSLRNITYRIDLSAVNIDPVINTAFLEDRFTGTSTPIDLTGSTISYTFQASTTAGSKAADRFRLVFRQSVVVPVNIVSVKAVQVNRDIRVEWKVASQVNVARYEVERSADGRSFTRAGELAASGTEVYSWLDAGVSTGTHFYRIRAVDQNGTFRYSSVVKVQVGSGKAGITVSPNPVTGNFLNLQFSNLEAGKYGIRLINMIGQTVYKREMQHAGGSASESFVLPSGIPAGQYQLDVVTPDNLHEVHPVIIQSGL